MGNQKFKLSYIIPNAWFHKLKHLTKPPKTPPLSTTTTTTKPPLHPPSTTISPPPLPPRKSYHFTRENPTQKSKPKPKPISSKPTKKNSVPGLTHRSNSPETEPGFFTTFEKTPPRTSEIFDILIDNYKYKKPGSESNPINGFDFQLPRIITKPNQSTKEEKPVKKLPVHNSPVFGVRLKINSPKIMGMKQGQNGNYTYRKSIMKKRRSISESLAVVKSSNDPQRDFMESMVEMIEENNLKSSNDLEDLLACYLSLNSNEYHDVIINVFKQIWFDLNRVTNHKL